MSKCERCCSRYCTRNNGADLIIHNRELTSTGKQEGNDDAHRAAAFVRFNKGRCFTNAKMMFSERGLFHQENSP